MGNIRNTASFTYVLKVYFSGSSIMYVVLFNSTDDIRFYAFYLGYFLIAFSFLI
jgi:hypothetical protein